MQAIKVEREIGGRTLSIETGTLAELRHLTRSTVTAHTREPATGVDRLPGVHDVAVDGATVSFSVDAAELDAAIGYLHGRGLVSLVCQPPTLEQPFLEHYDDDLAALEARR